MTLMDTMLATSAAPAHFPSHTFGKHIFVDGGLAANAPDMHALRCAKHMWPGADVRMLSVGTANPLIGRDPSKVPRRGLGWAKPVIELCMNSQEQQAIVDATRALDSRHYLRLNAHPSADQTKKVDFDVARAASTKILASLADDLVREQLANNRARLMSML